MQVIPQSFSEHRGGSAPITTARHFPTRFTIVQRGVALDKSAAFKRGAA